LFRRLKFIRHFIISGYFFYLYFPAGKKVLVIIGTTLTLSAPCLKKPDFSSFNKQ